MSDPSASSGARFPGGFRRATSMKKSRSETEKVDNSSENASDEVEAGTLQDGTQQTDCLLFLLPLACIPTIPNL